MAFDYAQIDPQYTPGRPVALVGKVAIVPMSGPISFDAPPSWAAFMGMNTTGGLCALLSTLARADAIEAVVIDLHCPGGSTWGVTDFEAAFASLKQAGKKVYSIAHDMAASLGMLPLTLADEAIATPSAVLGYMGSRNAFPYYDITKPLKRDGVETFLPAFPAGKGAGVDPGMGLPDDWKRAEMAAAESVAMPYFNAMASARGLNPQALINFNAYAITPQAALAANLIDAIETFPAFLARVLTAHNGSAPAIFGPGQEDDDMSTATTINTPPTVISPQPAAATYADLVSTLGKQDTDLIVACLDQRLSLDQAKALKATRESEAAAAKEAAEKKALADQVATLTQQVATLTAELADAKAKKVPGVAGVTASAPNANAAGTPTNFEAAAQSCMAAAKNDKNQAVYLASRKFPHLASEYMLAGEPALNLRDE